MKTLKLTLALVAFMTFTTSGFAQTADEIISKHITKMGGAEKLRAIKAVKMEMSVNAGGMEIPVEVVQMKGGKMYIKLNLQGMEMTQMASDGTTLWVTNFQTMKPEKADAETTANAKLKQQDFPEALLDYKTKGYSAEYIGKETREGKEVYKVKLTKKPVTMEGVKVDDISYYFFDLATGFAIATESEIQTGPMKGEKSISTMGDYKEVSGVYLPYAMNQGGQELKINKITVNPVVDEKAFAFPTE